MKNAWHYFKTLATDRILRRRILFVIGAMIVFRVLAAIPIPGVDPSRISGLLANSQLAGILNVFSGGGLSRLSIIMLGVAPYITSSIILQLLTLMVPSLKSLYHEEGEIGRKKFYQYARILTVPLAALQGISFLILLSQQGVIVGMTTFGFIVNVIIIVAGALLIMWIGELISEFGIGNGISLLIFAGIVAAIPGTVNQFAFTFDTASIPVYIAYLAIALIAIAGVVAVTEAERPVAVTYAKQSRGMSVGGVPTYLPLRLNQAGVMPIIFALSILLFPQLIANLLSSSTNSILLSISHGLSWFVANQILYGAVYFVLVFFFTYFYTAVTFDPEQMANNLQKSGAFISGVRPGQSTVSYVSDILSRVTFVGALFLATVAILPLILQFMTGSQNLAIGGTSLLIAVSVSIDLIKKIEAELSLREY